MGFWTKTWDWLTDVETKSSLPTARSAEDIRKDIIADQRIDLNAAVSAVYGCARVIAEGLALPPCYVTRDGEHAATHPLYYLLNASPNDLQTAYEFREMQGYHMALDGNAYSWLNRAPNGSILEILPLDPHYVQVVPTSSRLGTQVKYFVFGVEMPADEIWHQKGPATKDYTGLSMLDQARSAIKLARHQEEYGAKLFENGARPAGLLTTNGTLTPEQRADLKRSWEQQYSGTGNAHKTALLTGDFQYHPLGSTANEAQFIEARKFQIEEICRFFRVSPTKLFHNAGSQSYASVEQAHIAHDADTDAHWHTRFVQSANKTLLTQKERAQGYQIILDNRDFLRGTAVERMQYYQIGRAIGVLSANEIREMEGFERSADPAADQLAPAANLFGGNDGGADRPPA